MMIEEMRSSSEGMAASKTELEEAYVNLSSDHARLVTQHARVQQQAKEAEEASAARLAECEKELSHTREEYEVAAAAVHQIEVESEGLQSQLGRAMSEKEALCASLEESERRAEDVEQDAMRLTEVCQAKVVEFSKKLNDLKKQLREKHEQEAEGLTA